MIFIATCSQDTTTDIVAKEFDANDLFRFNIDKPKDFAWDFHREGFRVANKTNGKEITDKTLSSFYLRKPMYFDLIDIPKYGCVENWCREETDELFRDFYRECQSRGHVALVCSKSDRFGKLRQLLIAEKYFKVAPWHFFHGELPEDAKYGTWVVKSLTGTQIGEGKAFLVKEIDPKQLDLSYPWFIQEKIDGEEEVTIVYVNGEMYAASAPRSSFSTADSRLSLMEHPRAWPRCSLLSKEEKAIRAFMKETGYRFGRFDMIRKGGELYFLELNPNGQWAWLDPENEHGLVTMVADAIKAEDRRNR